MEETEKFFDPGLRIVDANPPLRGALTHFGAMGCFSVLMGYLLYLGFAWLGETFAESYAWLARIGSLLLALLCLLLFAGVALTLRDSARQIRLAGQLRRKSVLATATVVGREKVDRVENDMFYLFYQFRPDFVVRFCDETSGQQFYRLPLGSELPVRYLPGRPEVSSPARAGK